MDCEVVGDAFGVASFTALPSCLFWAPSLIRFMFLALYRVLSRVKLAGWLQGYCVLSVEVTDLG
jgi:hypothetical protein